MPWKKHWYHKYASPNKLYEYAHAGLYVLTSSSMEMVIKTVGENCTTFDDYDSLVSQLLELKRDMDDLYNKRIKLFQYARSKLVWENHEKNIILAYQAC